jgi:hypothetical protein
MFLQTVVELLTLLQRLCMFPSRVCLIHDDDSSETVPSQRTPSSLEIRIPLMRIPGGSKVDFSGDVHRGRRC